MDRRRQKSSPSKTPVKPDTRAPKGTPRGTEARTASSRPTARRRDAEEGEHEPVVPRAHADVTLRGRKFYEPKVKARREEEMSLAQRWGDVAIELYTETAQHWPSLRKVLEGYFKTSDHNPIERAWINDAVQDMVRYRRRVSVATDTAPDWGEVLLDGALAMRGRLDKPRKLTPRQVKQVIELHQYAPLDTVKGLADAASLPEWLADRLLIEVGKDRAYEVAQSLNKHPDQVLRVNTIKASVADTMKRLSKERAGTTAGKLASQALRLNERTDVFALETWRDGWVEMQDEGSQLIAELVAPPPGGKVVDFCAGAGGKTLALAAAMGNRGRLLACDINHSRLSDLKRRVNRAGVTNHQTLKLPATEWPKEFQKSDRVLVDAPCTGLGVLRRHPESRWYVQPEDVAELTRKQRAIINQAWELVAPGGRLIYATCSLLRAENEDIAKAFETENLDATAILPREVLGAARMQGLEDASKKYMRTWPDRHDCDAFFVALWRKTEVKRGKK